MGATHLFFSFYSLFSSKTIDKKVSIRYNSRPQNVAGNALVLFTSR